MIMSFMEDLKRWVSGSEDDDDLDDFTPPVRKPSARQPESNPANSFNRQSKIVNINATAQIAMVVVKPEKFENAAEIADHLREKRTVVLNLEQTNKDVARRLVDFLSGVIYAQDGKIQKVANSTFLFTPYNVEIMGDVIMDELENNGLYI